MRFPVAALLVLSVAGVHAATSRGAEPRPDAQSDRAHTAVEQALQAARDVRGQAKNLVALAWPAGKRDDAVVTAARIRLAGFGENALAALREAMNTVKHEYTDEVMATTLGAARNVPKELGREYLPIAIDALWVGNHDAKVLALQALADDHSRLAVNPMIDSAIEDPALAQKVLETLGTMRNLQARFYLEKVMMEGSPELRPIAASSLAQIGGAALGPLKNALKAPTRDARMLAARSLLPAATEYDVGAIYEYIEKHGDDDDELTRALKVSADNIEKAIAARDAKAAAGATGPKDF